MIWAAVPLKSPDGAKSRLRDVLDAAGRRELYLFMAGRVLAALKAVPQIGHVAVVTSSPEMAKFARSLNVDVVSQDGEGGAADAACAAVQAAMDAGAHGLLIVPGDVPMITSEAIGKIIRPSAEGKRVVLAPDRRWFGTNALYATPPDAIPMCFGPRSFALHRAAAEARAIPCHELEVAELALDIDEPADLDIFCESAVARGSLDLPDRLRQVLLRATAGEG